MEKQTNIWLGTILIVIAILVIIDTLDFPSFISAGQKLPGPNFVPVLLSIILIICGSYEIFMSLLSRTSKNSKKSLRENLSDWGQQNVIIVIVSLILYVPIVQEMGFVITTFLFSFILMVRLKTSWFKGAIISAILVIVIVLLFTKMFKVPLPEGLFMINF